MENTNKYHNYNSVDTSYIINQIMSSGSAAPEFTPEHDSKPDLHLHNNSKVKSDKEIRRDQKNAFMKMVSVVAVCAICFVSVFGVLKTLAVKNELTKEIASTQVEIANAESEYISLQSELNSLVSMSMIDQYAVDKLGMTKARTNQIQYMDVSEFKASRQASVDKTTDNAVKQGITGNK